MKDIKKLHEEQLKNVNGGVIILTAEKQSETEEAGIRNNLLPKTDAVILADEKTD